MGTRSADGARVWDGQRWRLVGPESPFAPSVGQIEPPAISQIRIGRRGKIVAAAVAVLVLLGIAGNVLLGNITTPEAVASDYISAVGSNNADGIWADSILATSQTAYFGSAAYSLATRDELKAMLNLPENKHSSRDSIKVTQLADNGAGTVMVSAQYNEAGHPVSEQLGLTRSTTDKKFGFYPYWRVVVMPGYLSFTGAPDGALVSVDGIGIPAGTATVATYPGTHQVTAGATTIFAADTEKVTAAPNQAGQTTFKTQLTNAAKDQAAQALTTAFAACAKVTTLAAQNCPQNLPYYGIQEPVTWTLVGDPTSDLKFGTAAIYGPAPMLVAEGHYMMTLSFGTAGTPPAPGHRYVGGPFEAAFTVTGNSLALTGLGSGGQAPPLPAPSDASDTALKAAVTAKFKQCATITTASSNDCPQGLPGVYNPSNVHWTLVGDPGASGNSNWDGTVGAYTVSGTFDMTASYDDTYAGAGQKYSLSSWKYSAHVLWTGGAANVVWIDGSQY